MAERGLEHGDACRARLDRGRGRAASRPPTARSRCRTWAGTSSTSIGGAPSGVRRPRRRRPTSISCTATSSVCARRARPAGDGRLWRAADRRGRPRQSGRHAVPPEKSQAAGLRLIAQFPAVAAMTRVPPRTPGAGRTPRSASRSSGSPPSSRGDLDDLCEATDAAIERRRRLRLGQAAAARRWKPTGAACCWCPSASCSWPASTARSCGSAQLLRPSRNNEAQAHRGQLHDAPSSRPGRAATASRAC